MPTAVRLSWKTIPLISDSIPSLTERKLHEELTLAQTLGETRYFVKDITINNIYYTWINVREDYFREKFATMPAGIDDHFVKVTPVKDEGP